ncbi:MAG TPA: acyltransferase [Oxalicibacterium sp.]|nr:acyltransferase [Oxalicibacterium sp.]
MPDTLAGEGPVARASRIDELESIRGIAALLVVLYHIPNWNASLYELPVIRNSYLMVNLFFVLSGFVIYKAYAHNIRSRDHLLRFLFLRLGRLYPVHFVFLMVFLLMEVIKYFAYVHYGVKSSKTTPFVENNLVALVQQLFLVQAIGPTDHALTFNAPAWSISVEFYTYLVFGLIVLHCGRWKTAVFALLALACGLMISTEPRSGFFDLLQCLCGFFLGCCTAYVSEKLTLKLSASSVGICLFAILFYLQFKTFEEYDILIYPLTAALVLSIVLSGDGVIKQVLRLPLLTWLGMISYSVYMSHSALLWLCNQVHRFIFKQNEIWFEGRLVPQLSFAEALISYVVIIALLLYVSDFVYHKLEKPYREKSRKLVFKLPGSSVRTRAVK